LFVVVVVGVGVVFGWQQGTATHTSQEQKEKELFAGKKFTQTIGADSLVEKKKAKHFY